MNCRSLVRQPSAFDGILHQLLTKEVVDRGLMHQDHWYLKCTIHRQKYESMKQKQVTLKWENMFAIETHLSTNVTTRCCWKRRSVVVFIACEPRPEITQSSARALEQMLKKDVTIEVYIAWLKFSLRMEIRLIGPFGDQTLMYNWHHQLGKWNLQVLHRCLVLVRPKAVTQTGLLFGLSCHVPLWSSHLYWLHFEHKPSTLHCDLNRKTMGFWWSHWSPIPKTTQLLLGSRMAPLALNKKKLELGPEANSQVRGQLLTEPTGHNLLPKNGPFLGRPKGFYIFWHVSYWWFEHKLWFIM